MQSHRQLITRTKTLNTPYNENEKCKKRKLTSENT